MCRKSPPLEADLHMRPIVHTYIRLKKLTIESQVAVKNVKVKCIFEYN